MSSSSNTIETFANQDYKWGFVTDIEADAIPRGLSEDVVRLILILSVSGLAYRGIEVPLVVGGP